MDAALLKLMTLQARAAVRRSLRGVKSARGAVFFAVGVVVFLLWIGPTLLTLHLAPRNAVDPAKVREYLPAALLLACAGALLAPGDKALYFTPAEVNFLFPGPFSRRQLLGYKTAKAAFGAAGMALFMSVAMLRFAPTWAGALVGSFLSLLLIHLFTTCVVIVGQTVGAAAYTRARRIALAVVIGAVTLSIGPAIVAGSGGDALATVRRFSASPAGRALLAPFQPFGRAFTAGSIFPGLVGWSAAAAGIDAALLAVAMWLDANYLEAAAAGSRRVYERIQRVRRGGFGGPLFGGGAGAEAEGEGGKPTAPAAGPSGVARWARRFHVPNAPWLGGAGPLLWRQLTTAGRRAAGLLFVLAICGGVFATVFVAGRRGKDVNGALFPIAAWFTLLLVANLKFDFRGDLDQMPWLKSLPLRPTAVAAGQIAAPVMILAAAHALIFGGAAVLVPSMRAALAAAAVLAVPFDLVLIGLENLLFLLFPSRGAALPNELGGLGRQVVMFLLKLVTVGFAAGAAAGIAAVVYLLTRSTALAVGVAFGVLTAEGLALVPLVAVAYARFDPSSDTPP